MKTKEERQSQFTAPPAAAPVLVGVDGGGGGRDVLALARELSALRGARCLVAVAGPGPIAEAREALGDPETPIEEIGVTSTGRVLCRIAERDLAGTIVIGSTRRSRIGRATLGSVGERVLSHAPCEVVVAPRGYATTPPHRFPCDSDVDLLVTGCRRPVAHLPGNSVTHHLIDEAPCPVLVVPHAREV